MGSPRNPGGDTINSMKNFNRREFSLLFGAAAAALPLAAAKKIPVGLQLYSVRKLCAEDLPGTLAGVKKAGYDGVEFAGYYNRSAVELKKLLDDNGLKCCGTHTALPTLLGDELAKTIEFNKAIGNRNLIVPSLPKKHFASKAEILTVAKTFTEISAKCKAAGMRAGYHNHAIEFQTVEGELPWTLIFENTPKEFIMQVDTGNAANGGGDYLAALKKFPGRAKTVHLKEHAKGKKGALIGEGDTDWKTLLSTCEKTAGTEWFIIEEESGLYPGLESATRSITSLRKLMTS